MDKFATLEPVRLYNNPLAAAGGRLLSRNHQTPKGPPSAPLVGRLPSDLHLLILAHLPIPDFPSYSRCSRATAALSSDEKIWEARWKALAVEKYSLGSVLDELENKSRGQLGSSRAAAPPIITVDDEFGEFASVDVVNAPPDEMGDFVGAFDNINISPSPTTPSNFKPTYRMMYIRAHNLLRPLTQALSSPPHLILITLSSAASTISSLRQQAKSLHLLSLFLSPGIKPVRQWHTMYGALRSAMDRFDANVLAAFDGADSKGDEDGMREAAESSWEVWDSGGGGDWEMGKVWAEKREVFYEQGKWKPLDNVTCVNSISPCIYLLIDIGVLQNRRSSGL